MRTENVRSNPFDSSRYLGRALTVLGVIAFSAGAYVAWPALAHLGTKLV